jgi:hypothetical protein
MSLEEFIITAFCWVEDTFADVTAGIKLRTRGFAPRLSDSEVITLELVGEWLGHEGDEAIWTYFKQHWAAWFPALGDRSTFVRQAANLWQIKQWLHERLVADLGARTAVGYIIDGFPITVCKLARAVRSHVLKAEADYGYCAAKREYYYGLKANLLIDLRGVAVGITVTAANVDERDSAYDVLQAIEGLVLGDKGYRWCSRHGYRTHQSSNNQQLVNFHIHVENTTGLYPPAIQSRLRSAGHRSANARAPEHEGTSTPLVVKAVAAGSQAGRNGDWPVRATLRVGENPGA